MKINISKNEYKILLEMLYLSDWMMTAHETDPVKMPGPHQALKHRLLSYYKEMSAEDYIEYEPELEDYFFTKKLDDSIIEKFIKPYDSETFWEELIDRLATRDLINEVGEEKYYSMEYMERAKRLMDFEDRYGNEFEKNGLENLSIKQHNLVEN